MRNHLAEVDLATGQPTAWDPGSDYRVYAMAVTANTVYAGGLFTSIGGQARNYIAALDKTTGQATAWDPNASSYVFALAVSENTVFAGGQFAFIGGDSRPAIAALDATTGLATGWDASAYEGEVRTIVVSGNTVYAGGSFTSIGGQTRNNIAALDKSTGQATAWNPSASGDVYAIIVPEDLTAVLAAGLFFSIGGQSRNHLAALDATTGLATAWNPNPDKDVVALAVYSNIVYAGGVFHTIGGQVRNHVAALDATTGLAAAWNPDVGPPDFYINALVASGSTVYVGGGFATIAGDYRLDLAGVTSSTVSVPANPTPGAAIALQMAPSPLHGGGFVWFTQPKAGPVSLDLVDLQGRTVQEVMRATRLEAGQHRVPIDSGGLPPGVYEAVLYAAGGRATAKFVVLR
jgi:hypothetical protein